MRQVIKNIYQFSELSEKAKQVALSAIRNNTEFYDDAVIDDAKQIAALMGIEIDMVYWSGFSCQGDGASFTGCTVKCDNVAKEVKDYAPLDSRLHSIAEQWQALQSECRITTEGRYSHSNTMCFEWLDDEEHTEAEQVLRDFADWIYSQLEKENDFQMGDENLTELADIDKYEFTEDGEIYTK